MKSFSKAEEYASAGGGAYQEWIRTRFEYPRTKTKMKTFEQTEMV